MTAIKAATLNGAQLIGMDKELGTVEVGKIADLVAAPGDPLADIREMTRIRFVMTGGLVHKHEP
jgi:imidazolonepropionase-like amidohydrolase